MNQDIIQRIISQLSKEGLDAVICISPENFAYVCGFVVPSQPIMRWRHAAVVITASGDTGVLAVDMEESTVQSRVGSTRIQIWGEFTDCPMEQLSTLLKEMGLGNAAFGIEMDYLPAWDLQKLKSALPDCTITASQGMMDRLRQIKTDREIKLLRRLSRISGDFANRS